MNPYVSRPVRVTYVEVIGRIWMPAVQAATTYPLSDHDLANIETFTHDEVSSWLYTHAGDFQSIEDFHAVVGSEELPWSKEDSELTFSDLTSGEVD